MVLFGCYNIRYFQSEGGDKLRKVLRWELPDRTVGNLSAPGLAEGHIGTQYGKANFYVHATECELHGDEEAWDGTVEVEIWMDIRFGDVIMPCDVGDALTEKAKKVTGDLGFTDILVDRLAVKGMDGLRFVAVFGRPAGEIDQAGFEQLAKELRAKFLDLMEWNREALDKDVVYSEKDFPEEE